VNAYDQAARTHERAAVLELAAAELFERCGNSEAAQRHLRAADRQVELAEADHRRSSGGF
jgi:hypothetical protein